MFAQFPAKASALQNANCAAVAIRAPLFQLLSPRTYVVKFVGVLRVRRRVCGVIGATQRRLTLVAQLAVERAGGTHLFKIEARVDLI